MRHPFPFQPGGDRPSPRRYFTAQPSSIRTRAAGVQSVARDIGNIAILEDSDGVVARRNTFNLNARTLRFLPQSGTSGYRFETAADSYDAAQATSGTPLALDDDDSRIVPLPFAFSFYGRSYSSAFINSDGNISFVSPDGASADRSVGRLNAGPPRIAALYRDLDPSVTPASVRVLSTSSIFAVSWVNVPEYGTSKIQTFQVRLFPDGRIETAFPPSPPRKRLSESPRAACKARARW